MNDFTQIDVVAQFLQQKLYYLMNNFQDNQYPLINHFNNEHHVQYENALDAGKRSFNQFLAQGSSDNTTSPIMCSPIKDLKLSKNYPKSESTDMSEDEAEGKTQQYDHFNLLKKITQQGIYSSLNTNVSSPERKLEAFSLQDSNLKINRPIVLYQDKTANIIKRNQNFIESDYMTEIDNYKVKEDIDHENSPDDKQNKTKSAQSRWKNFPGHILIGIKNICQSYSQRLDKLKLKCTDEILDQLSEDTKYRLYKFMKEYDYKFKTYSGIKKLLREGQYNDITEVIIKIVDALLSEKNANDFEKWLRETRMADKSKDMIRKNKETLRNNFIKQISLEDKI